MSTADELLDAAEQALDDVTAAIATDSPQAVLELAARFAAAVDAHLAAARAEHLASIVADLADDAG